MNNENGKPLNEIGHIKQSILEILKTAKGSRVMLPEYGSNLFNLVDKPANGETLAKIIAETVSALSAWEKRIKVNEVKVEFKDESRVFLTLYATYLINDKEDLELEVIL